MIVTSPRGGFDLVAVNEYCEDIHTNVGRLLLCVLLRFFPSRIYYLVALALSISIIIIYGGYLSGFELGESILRTFSLKLPGPLTEEVTALIDEHRSDGSYSILGWKPEQLRTLSRLIDTGIVDVRVGHVFSLDAVRVAHKLSQSRHAKGRSSSNCNAENSSKHFLRDLYETIVVQ
ncbi:hypothetical protein BG842_17175 [Haladaptatus sp. W1]|uniref:zinc-binding dehydrogenase n=1 Tax=Haladaptatus sp. W1 TaxID=1897478 RepID=UPI000849DD51|nr:hypothetical protein BG842_17175 [Haladaptatus sp. W1]